MWFAKILKKNDKKGAKDINPFFEKRQASKTVYHYAD